MSRTRIYLILQAVLCILLVFLLSVSAVDIYREGLVRKEENPLEPIYTREIVAEKAAPIAPLFFVSIGLLIAGLVLEIKDENANKAIEDSELRRNIIAARVVKPSDAMCRARSEQKRWLLIGFGVFALCMLPILLYIINPAHFPQEDLEGMLYRLIRVVFPWSVVGLSVLAVCFRVRERFILREIEAARDRLKEEEEAGVRPEKKAAPLPGYTGMLQTVLIAVAIGFIVAGVINGSARDVLYKAINICTECIGLG